MESYFESILDPQDRGKLRPYQTVPEFLDALGQYDTSIAFAEADTEMTYAAFRHGIGQMRAMLAQHGFAKGDNIAILLPNGSLAAQAFLAIASYGGCALILPAALQADNLVGCLTQFDVKGVFCTQEFNATPHPFGPDIIALHDDFSQLQEIPAAQVLPEDAAAIFLTGGTTGAPKGAILSHQALLRGAYNGALVPDGIFGHTTYAILPFCHVFGMIRSVLSFLYTGSKVCTCSDMRAIFHELPLYQPDTLVLVPGLIQLLLQVTRMKGAGVLGGKLKTIIAGGAAVPQLLIEAFLEYGVMVMPGYGLTETANLVSGNVHALKKPGSVGKPYPEQDVKIQDGEIWVRGDNLMLGYYNNPQETQQAFCDGWFRTGDLGRFDTDGFLYITGRIKNLIVLANGENVAPEELENLLYAHPAVKDCLVREMEDSIGVEIQLQPTHFPDATLDELERAAKKIAQTINATLPGYKQIHRVVVRTQDFEKTGSMKVKRT